MQLVPESGSAIAAKERAQHDAANAATGFRFVRALAVEKAALDRGLSSKCVFVLAAISHFMNSTTGRAWPSYRRIAELTGYSEDSIERAIRELKATNYLFTERKAPPTGGRAVVQYGLGAICPNDIDEMLTAAVTAVADEMRQRERSNSDPGKKPGVRHGLTPPKMSGSETDPDFSIPSDPDFFPPQEPLAVEPLLVSEFVHAREDLEFVDAQDVARFNSFASTWGNPGGKPLGRERTDQLLGTALREHDREPPAILANALRLVLAEAAITEPRVPGPKAFFGWFRAVLRSEVGKLKLSQAEHRARAVTAQHVAEHRHEQATVPRPSRRAGDSLEATRRGAFGEGDNP